MTTRAQNERQYFSWSDLPDGSRVYWMDVAGKGGWQARYLKQVDAQETTIRFWQEIYNEQGALVEIHQKYPTDTGYKKV
ncbi:MAG: hypothetical protein ACR2IE_10955 [Candidatus Sumerlaeaceae bacterium]